MEARVRASVPDSLGSLRSQTERLLGHLPGQAGTASSTSGLPKDVRARCQRQHRALAHPEGHTNSLFAAYSHLFAWLLAMRLKAGRQHFAIRAAIIPARSPSAAHI